MQPSSAWQLVFAEPVRSSQPHAPGEPKNASHLLTSHDEHSERPVNLQTASHAGVKFVAGVFGGSHSSLGWLTTPSPQRGAAIRWQVASQVVPLGGSHSSPGCTMPLPHTIGMFWQVASQVVPLGGSHCSGRYGPGGASTMLLPHTGICKQFESQVVPLGGSHCSPGSRVPLPQVSGTQVTVVLRVFAHAVTFTVGLVALAVIESVCEPATAHVYVVAAAFASANEPADAVQCRVGVASSDVSMSWA